MPLKNYSEDIYSQLNAFLLNKDIHFFSELNLTNKCIDPKYLHFCKYKRLLACKM